MVTIEEICDRIVEIRGKCLSVIKAEITATIFEDESQIVYMATEDYINWRWREFVFVIPADVLSTNSMLARGYWAETKMFDLPHQSR